MVLVYNADCAHDDPHVTLYRFLSWTVQRIRDGRQLALELHRANPDDHRLQRAFERMDEIFKPAWDAMEWARPDEATGMCERERHYLYGGEKECGACEAEQRLRDGVSLHLYIVLDALSTGTDEDVVAEELLKLHDRDEPRALRILADLDKELETAYPHRYVRVRPEIRAVIHKVREEMTNLRWNEEAQG